MIAAILKTMSGCRFDVSCESATQNQIAEVLTAAGIGCQREVMLSSGNRIDFMVGTIGIEVKIDGQAKAIYRQCERYCGFDQVETLLLVTNRAMGLPREINGKPCYMHLLGRSWL